MQPQQIRCEEVWNKNTFQKKKFRMYKVTIILFVICLIEQICFYVLTYKVGQIVLSYCKTALG